MGFSTVGGVAAHESTHRSGGADAIAGALGLAAIPATLTGKDSDTIDSIEGANIITNSKIKLIRKTADEGVLNSTTLQNDDHLLFAVGANEVWVFYIVLRVDVQPATGNNDLRYGFSIPAAGAIKLMKAWDTWGSGTPPPEVDGTTTITGVQLGTSTQYIQFMGLYIGGANAGNVQLQWAQNTADPANTTYVRANSAIVAFKVS